MQLCKSSCLLITILFSLLSTKCLGQTFNTFADVDSSPAPVVSGLNSATVPGQGIIYFVGEDPEAGRELWVTDGTAFGTHRVFDLFPGVEGSSPNHLTATPNGLYFIADHSLSNRNVLYFLQNPNSIPVVIKDFNTPNYYEGYSDIFGYNGNFLYASADDSVSGEELWVTDLNTQSTTMKESDVGNPLSANLRFLGKFGSYMYFFGYKLNLGYEILRSSNGASPILVKDVNPGSTSSSPEFLGYLPPYVYFSADTNSEGREVWRTNTGNIADTALVSDLAPGTASSTPAQVGTVGGYVLFRAKASNSIGEELYRTNGVSTTLVKDINTTPDGSSTPLIGSTVATTSGDRLFFTAFAPTSGRELWKTDGTTGGTVSLADIAPGAVSSNPYALTSHNGVLFISAYGGGASGYEPYVTSADGNNVFKLSELNPAEKNSFPYSLGSIGSNFYFVAYNNNNVQTIYSSSLNNGQVNVVSSIVQNRSADSYAVNFFNIAGQICFSSSHVGYNQIFACNNGLGTPINIIKPNFNINNLVQPQFLGGSILMSGYDSQDGSGGELWRSDGTSLGTLLVKNINLQGDSSPYNLTEAGGKVFFFANDSTNNHELWVSDGSEAGTLKVKDLNGDNESGVGYGGSDMVALGNRVVYIASDQPNMSNNELWSSDGTPAGTFKLIDIAPSGGSNPSSLITFNNKVYFSADAGAASYGRELWSTNGLPGGTSLIKDINVGSSDSLVFGSAFKVVFKDKLYFTGSYQNKYGIYRTDGTASGTELFIDPNSFGSFYTYFGFNQDDKFLYLIANDGTHGNELWKTDGTVSGTTLLRDISPGSENTQISYNFYEFDGKVYVTIGLGTGNSVIYQIWRTKHNALGVPVDMEQVTNAPLSSGGYYGAYLNNSLGNLLFGLANIPGIGLEPIYMEDQCPDIDGLVIAGACGCGIPVTDINSNSIPDCKGSLEVKPILVGLREAITALKAIPKLPKNPSKKKIAAVKKAKKAYSTQKAIVNSKLQALVSFQNSILIGNLTVSNGNAAVKVLEVVDSTKQLLKTSGKIKKKLDSNKSSALGKIVVLEGSLIF